MNVRINGESERALRVLTADGTSTSVAVRQALIDAVRFRRREQMRREALESMNDPEEQLILKRAMTEWEDLRAW
ncbi:MAG: hypothetical protein M3519_09800 [Actinomycetota bacterium]|nr:hypothetical protein [Actinomycetota bacterium]